MYLDVVLHWFRENNIEFVADGTIRIRIRIRIRAMGSRLVCVGVACERVLVRAARFRLMPTLQSRRQSVRLLTLLHLTVHVAVLTVYSERASACVGSAASGAGSAGCAGCAGGEDHVRVEHVCPVERRVERVLLHL